MSFFSVDSPLYKFLSRLLDVIKLNFLWLLFSLPIVTIGASTVAACSVALKMVDEEEGYVGRAFVKAFKENFKQGILLGLLSIAAFYVVYLDLQLFHAIESNPLPLLIIGILASVYFAFSFVYAFPLVARYQNSLINTLRNSMQISLKYFVRTLVLLVVLAFILALMVFNTTTIFFGILIGPAFIIFTISAFSLRVFQIIEKDTDTVAKEKMIKKVNNK
ncbi:MAG: YesL family protein [Mobilitalea sp.]